MLLLRLVCRLLRVQRCLLVVVVLLLLQLLMQRILLRRLCLAHSWQGRFLLLLLWLLLGTLLWLLHGLAADPEAASCPVHSLLSRRSGDRPLFTRRERLKRAGGIGYQR